MTIEAGVDHGDDDRTVVEITLTCEPEDVFRMLMGAILKSAQELDPDLADQVTDGWTERDALQAALRAAQRTSDHFQSELREERALANHGAELVGRLADLLFPEWRKYGWLDYDEVLDDDQRELLRAVQEFTGQPED